MNQDYGWAVPANVVDQFYEFDPASPPPIGTPVSFYKYVLTDQNDDGDIDEFDADAVAGLDVTASWPGDTITIDVLGTGNVTFTGTTLYLSDGSIIFTPTDGQILQSGNFVSSTYVSTQGPLLISQLGPPCFTPGTMIETPYGENKIELLKVGDLISTVDSGPQPIRFIRKRSFEPAHLRRYPRHVPITLLAGALAQGLPDCALTVSPQHRILIRSKVAERMFGEPEILVSAAALIGSPGISRSAGDSPVTYIHVLLDQHHIIKANGAEVESLLLGRNILRQFTRAEILRLKESAPDCFGGANKPVRTLVSGKRVQRYLDRVGRNGQPISKPKSP